MTSPYCLSLEGNPATLKSRLFQLLEKKYENYRNKIIFIKEPVESFINLKDNNNVSHGNPFVKLFKKRISASTLQHHVLNCMEEEYGKIQAKNDLSQIKVIISDRSLVSATVFIAYYLGKGQMSKDEANILLNRMELIKQKLFPLGQPNKMIFLKLPVETNRKIMKNRNRDGETLIITKKYLQDINRLYETCFPCMLDENDDFSHICNIINEKLELTNLEIEKLPNVIDIRAKIINDIVNN